MGAVRPAGGEAPPRHPVRARRPRRRRRALFRGDRAGGTEREGAGRPSRGPPDRGAPASPPGRPRRRSAPGTVVAEYVVRSEDGTSRTAPIRERIEIAGGAEDGWDAYSAFAAAGTSELGLADRYEGRWEDIGMRQCETVFLGATDYFLWVWTNPGAGGRDRGRRAGRARGARARRGDHGRERAASTRSRARPRGPWGDRPRTRRGGHTLAEPEVRVDRGVAGYAFRLPGRRRRRRTWTTPVVAGARTPTLRARAPTCGSRPCPSATVTVT